MRAGVFIKSKKLQVLVSKRFRRLSKKIPDSTTHDFKGMQQMRQPGTANPARLGDVRDPLQVLVQQQLEVFHLV